MSDTMSLGEFLSKTEPSTLEQWLATRPAIKQQIDEHLPSATPASVHRYLKLCHEYPLGEDTIKRYKKKLGAR